MSGMSPHEDVTAFGTVIVCLTGDEAAITSLQLGKDGESYPCQFDVGGMVAFRDLRHGLPVVIRKEQRVTINLFYG